MFEPEKLIKTLMLLSGITIITAIILISNALFN